MGPAPTIMHNVLPDVTDANETTYPVSGTCTVNGDTVVISVDDQNGGTAAVTTTTPAVVTCTGGAFSATLDVSSLDNGTNEIDVTSSIDDGINPIASDTDTVSKDDTAPTIMHNVLPDVTAANETTYPVSGTCTVNGDTVVISVDDQNGGTAAVTTTTPAVVTCTGGAFSATLDVSTLDNGTNEIDITSSIDDGVNPIATDVDTVDKDDTPPTITHGALPPGTLVNCAAYSDYRNLYS